MHARRAVIAQPGVCGFRCSADRVRGRRRRRPRRRRGSAGRSPDRSACTTRSSSSAASRSIARSAPTCHSLKLLAFRNLADPGGPSFTEAQAAAVAAEFKVTGRPERPGRNVPAAGPPRRSFPAAVRQRSGGAQRQRRRAAAGHVGAGQGARLRARLSLVHLRCVHAVPGGRPGLHPRHSRRLCGCARRVHAAAGRAVQQIFSRPRHRHAEAAERRAGRIHRRHADDRRPVRPRPLPPS